MSKNLVIVESPAKAKTIEKFLGKDYYVTSSYGHIRDLPKKELGVDVDNKFAPTYTVSPDKKKRVSELKKAVKVAETVWLATDEDREGEAISWHLWHALGLKNKIVKRIAFHEITKTAVTDAIKNPREINQNLVDAQQARRVLDRLVGYQISPVLWRKVQPGLSAGRVQSVAVRLIVEREREIENFAPITSFKITGTFKTATDEIIPAELAANIIDQPEAEKFIHAAISAKFSVGNVLTKPGTRSPAAPFTTSTLQQTAARKLGMSVKQTMTLAQRLYESGHITYMRTDSVMLAQSAITQAQKIITSKYGAEYHQLRTYKSKAGAQEAHEAIRPTDFSVENAGGDDRQSKLYQLIRARTLASQMTAAKLERTTITIASSNHSQDLIAKGEVIQFPGFLAVYQDAKIEDKLLPQVKTGGELTLVSLEAREVIKRGPARYNEAALVRTLEEMGIGRPSTYAPTISTVQARGYVEKGDVAGEERIITVITIQAESVEVTNEPFIYGRDKNKLLPTQIALLVNDFLTKHFSSVVDYDFTKEVEEEFDRIAAGKEQWNTMLADFYKPFSQLVEKAQGLSREEASGAREIGLDPKTKKPIIARMGRYGPMLQRGHAEDDVKPDFAPVPKELKLHEVTLDQALELFSLPRSVGKTTDGEDITSTYGRFGPYVKAGDTYAALPSEISPLSVDEKTARQLIIDKREVVAKREIAVFGDIKVLNGRFGPYVTNGKKNAKIPKDITPEDLDEKGATEILKKAPVRKRRRKS